MERTAMEFLFNNLLAFRLQHLALRVLKATEILEMASTVNFFFAVEDSNRFSSK